MAFRIHDSVVRGEIDNRVKGIVCGKIWVEGRPKPVVLELKGNAWPDLAGGLLTFPAHSLPKRTREGENICVNPLNLRFRFFNNQQPAVRLTKPKQLRWRLVE